MSEPLTAGDLIEELQKVPADTVLDWYGHGRLEFFKVEEGGQCYIEAEPVTAITDDFLSIDSMRFAEKLAVLGSAVNAEEPVADDTGTQLPTFEDAVPETHIDLSEHDYTNGEIEDVAAMAGLSLDTEVEPRIESVIQPQPVSEPNSSGHVHPAVLSVVGVLSFLALVWVVVMVGKR